MVRAKLVCSRIEKHHYRLDTVYSWIYFHAEYDTAIPEDQRFQKATPTGEIKMQIDNPAALEFFKPGNAYYVDFTEAM